MGAQISQDTTPEHSDEESSKIAPQSSDHQNQRRIPHTCEDISSHADSAHGSSERKPQEQLQTGGYVKENSKKIQVGESSNHNCLVLFPQDLSITWAQDKRFWHWPLLKESSDECRAVAELLNVCWLEVHGRFEIAKLSPGRLYEVVFVVKLKDPAYGWEVPVNLRLTLPDGSRQEHKEHLMEKPRGRWIEIPAGEFKCSGERAGEIEFSLYEYEGGEWKKGLVIKEARIRPKA